MAMSALPVGGQKRAAVQSMFNRIAPRYDVMNRVLSSGLDQRWRRAALDAVRIEPGDLVVDLASGTGDLAELAVDRGARVIAVDFAREMLRRARERRVSAALVRGDAAALPLASGSATALVCGFALRNFVSLPEVFDEAARVLVPGGRLAILEVDRPEGAWLRRAHAFYFDRLVPWIGGLLSDADAYRYLPQSTTYLPSSLELNAMIERAGFFDTAKRSLLLGAVQLITAARRAR
jgi:demethylmenaquinone methyltransferase/2-methoxy-6-polyprenyl-1,4-benzoquinol methylase